MHVPARGLHGVPSNSRGQESLSSYLTDLGRPAHFTLETNSPEQLIWTHSTTWRLPGPDALALHGAGITISRCGRCSSGPPLTALPSGVCSVSSCFQLRSATPFRGTGRNLLAAAGISPDNWLHFSPLGACLAVTTCGALTDSKTTEILQQELLQEESKGPAAQGRAPNEGREEKCTWTKAKNPPAPRISEATPGRGTLTLPGEEFCGNLGQKEPRHTPSSLGHSRTDR